MYFLFLFLCIYTTDSKKETLSDLYSLLDKPELLTILEKRLKTLEAHFPSEANCYDTSGVLDNGCSFSGNNGTIIKTTESLSKGAKFLEQFSNVSCPTECNSLCCNNPECDTSVYQDKVKLEHF